MGQQPYLSGESPCVQPDSIFAAPIKRKSASDDNPDEYTESYQRRGEWLVPATMTQAAAASTERLSECETPEPEAVMGNTATPTRQSIHKQWNQCGGFDWIEATVKGAFTEKYAETERVLEAARQKALLQGSAVPVAVFGATLCVEPTNAKLWGRTSFKWLVKFDGYAIWLAKSGQPSSCECAKVEISSLTLTREDPDRCWERVVALLRELGLDYQSSLVYRFDLCGDVVGVHCSVYCEAVANDQIIGRFRGETATFKDPAGRWTGFRLGQRNRVMLRVYDKIAELNKPGDKDLAEAKRVALVERRWNCFPDEATRIEFECRGTWLRERFADMQSVEDLLAGVGKITTYLTERFFRIVEGEVDRANRNQSRSKDFHPAWQKAIDAFCDWAGRVVADTLQESLAKMSPDELAEWMQQRGKNRLPDVSRACRMIGGNAVTIAALTPGEHSTRADVLRQVVRAVNRELGDNWRQKIEARRVKMWKTGALGVYGVDEFPFTVDTYKLGIDKFDDEWLQEIVDDELLQQDLPF